MNKTERKGRISDILDQVEDLKIELRDVDKAVQIAIEKAEALDDVLGEFETVDSWDLDQMREDILHAAINGTILDEVKEMVSDFRYELEEYMEDLSERRREPLEDMLEELAEFIPERLDYDGVDSIEQFIENIDEAVQCLKDMK